ncbi:hypothetical protein B6I21_08515 [candidate division KSB1 bacterium 4572_119]|nr:MAG: hypothetical protein B6I21_08515 [candidate division KSB1 bacterium 4572_119]
MSKTCKLALILSLSIFLIFSSLIFAQEKCCKTTSGRGYFIAGTNVLDFGRGYFIAGTNVLDLDALNSRLVSNGYKEFSNNFISIGGGGHGIINNIIIGGQGGTIFGGDETVELGTETFKTSLIGGYGFFFDELLTDPKRSVELNMGGFLLNLALGMDYFIKLGGDETGAGGLVVGVQAGYMIAPFAGDFQWEANELAGCPDIGFNGPYVKFMFGGGGYGK